MASPIKNPISLLSPDKNLFTSSGLDFKISLTIFSRSSEELICDKDFFLMISSGFSPVSATISKISFAIFEFMESLSISLII